MVAFEKFDCAIDFSIVKAFSLVSGFSDLRSCRVLYLCCHDVLWWIHKNVILPLAISEIVSFTTERLCPHNKNMSAIQSIEYTLLCMRVINPVYRTVNGNAFHRLLPDWFSTPATPASICHVFAVRVKSESYSSTLLNQRPLPRDLSSVGLLQETLRVVPCPLRQSVTLHTLNYNNDCRNNIALFLILS